MSRTYRKSKVTEEQSLPQVIKRSIDRLNRQYKIERYNVQKGVLAYDKAMQDFCIAYDLWLQTNQNYPTEPLFYEYVGRRYIKIEYDYTIEVSKITKTYYKNNRDGRLKDTFRQTAYKKHCAKDIRHFNRLLAYKVLKGDDSWENIPYPDTYLGKIHIWDYW